MLYEVITYIQRRRSLKTNTNQINLIDMKLIKTIKVDGMTCNHCKANVENNLKKLDFIESAEVNLSNKTVDLSRNNFV